MSWKTCNAIVVKKSAIGKENINWKNVTDIESWQTWSHAQEWDSSFLRSCELDRNSTKDATEKHTAI